MRHALGHYTLHASHIVSKAIIQSFYHAYTYMLHVSLQHVQVQGSHAVHDMNAICYIITHTPKMFRVPP